MHPICQLKISLPKWVFEGCRYWAPMIYIIDTHVVSILICIRSYETYHTMCYSFINVKNTSNANLWYFIHDRIVILHMLYHI